MEQKFLLILKKIGVIFYTNDNNEQNPDTKNFLQDLKRAIKTILAHPDHPDSPVLKGSNGRGTIYELTFKEEILRRIDGILDEINYNKLTLKEMLRRTKENQKDLEKISVDIVENKIKT